MYRQPSAFRTKQEIVRWSKWWIRFFTYGILVGTLVIVCLRLGLRQIGYTKEPVLLSGTGSMYPTFPKGEGETIYERAEEIVAHPLMWRYPRGFTWQGTVYGDYSIGRGDIVSFESDETREITQEEYGTSRGFVKRVIGLPGDEIEIREGWVWLNGEPQQEIYTAEPRSTFGGEFIHECELKTVPDEMLFVLGDNRKGSQDSRFELGWVTMSEIDHVLPWEEQLGTWDQNWRPEVQDVEEEPKIELDVQAYVGLLNKERGRLGVNELTWEEELAQAARLRGRVMFEDDDLSFEGGASGRGQQWAWNQVGYWQPLAGESHVQGYYKAEELWENQLLSQSSRNFLTDDKYGWIGVASVEGELNGCPTQLIVTEVAGYVSPDYSQEVVESWRTALIRLKEVQPGWEALKTYDGFYEQNKADVDRMGELIAVRIARMEAILKRMESNQWLTTEEKQWMEDDDALAQEQEVLARRLNGE